MAVLGCALGLGLSLCPASTAWAQAKGSVRPISPTANIYTCTDASGRTLTSDRLIPECAGREQRILAPDGSLRTVIGPTLSQEEQVARDARLAREAAARDARQRELRRDRLLLARYPDQDAHDLGREEALSGARIAIRAAEGRAALIAAERKALAAEAEFYVGKPLPTKLAQQIEVNEAATEAQRAMIGSQQAEIDRVNRIFDAELARLRVMWGRPAGASAVPASASPLPRQ